MQGPKVNTAQAEQIIQYLTTKVLRDSNAHIDLDTPLVSSGMVDSFALLETLLELEKVTNRQIPPLKVESKDMDTVRLMFSTAARVGKPRK